MPRLMKYNPAFLTDEELCKTFVARKTEFEIIVDTIRENSKRAVNNMLVVGQRGGGKTTLLLRVALEVRTDPVLSAIWYPLVFSEESYEVTSIGEFWLEALRRLSIQLDDEMWKSTYEELKKESSDKVLSARCLSQLMDFANSQGKRILMIVENLNMILGDQCSDEDGWALRHTLLNEPGIMLLGSAIRRFEEIENQSKAMFELFKILELKPVDREGCKAIWFNVTGEEISYERIRPIQILTGGNPRLLSIVSSFAGNMSLRKLMGNLVHLVDEHTEYFKSHLESLATVERKVYIALLDLWNESPARAIASVARLDVNKTSAFLKRLIERGAVATYGKKTKLYYVTERMYNIYYLLRKQGEASRRIKDVVGFMLSFYEPAELSKFALSIASEACQLDIESCRDHFFAYEAILERVKSDNVKRDIIEHTDENFLKSPNLPDTLKQLTSKYKQPVRDELSQENNELKLLKKDINYEEEKAYLRAIEINKNDAQAWVSLGGLYDYKLKRFEEAEKAYLKAIKIGENYAFAWGSLGVLYHDKLNRYEEAEKAYLRAIEIDENYAFAWGSLGELYHQLKRFEEAEKAYLKAIEKNPNEIYLKTQFIDLLIKMNRYMDSVNYADETIKQFPDNYELLDSLAWSMYKSGNPDLIVKGFSYAKSVFELKPEYLYVQHTLACILSRLNNGGEALKLAEKVLQDENIVKYNKDDVIELIILLAASGYPREALGLIESSPHVNLYEPLVCGLNMYMGVEVKTAVEIREIASDVVDRIKELHKIITEPKYGLT